MFRGLVMPILASYPALQAVTLVLLIRRLRRPEAAWRWLERICHILTLAVMPTAMLLLFTAVCESSWKGEKGMGWFGVINESWAGLAVLPIWVISAGSLVWALVNPRRLLRSRPNALMMLTMSAICLWYAGMPLWPETNSLVGLWKGLQHGLTKDMLVNAGSSLYLLAVPLAPCMSLLLLLIHVWQRRQVSGTGLGRGLVEHADAGDKGDATSPGLRVLRQDGRGQNGVVRGDPDTIGRTTDLQRVPAGDFVPDEQQFDQLQRPGSHPRHAPLSEGPKRLRQHDDAPAPGAEEPVGRRAELQHPDHRRPRVAILVPGAIQHHVRPAVNQALGGAPQGLCEHEGEVGRLPEPAGRYVQPHRHGQVIPLGQLLLKRENHELVAFIDTAGADQLEHRSMHATFPGELRGLRKRTHGSHTGQEVVVRKDAALPLYSVPGPEGRPGR